jgi:hypothetical protein
MISPLQVADPLPFKFQYTIRFREGKVALWLIDETKFDVLKFNDDYGKTKGGL